ncbi:MAG: MFS transporter [Candidatus Omnitrophica bacterium]|nr:MFS transporter [Candidatus Omnitrophota bacterium]MDD5352488.1 MFS transporter [Candidatus Omnitrophota bacterium]MDD5550086.1 MFS transporter [Candidatus Omnitrophota bacterium]
MFSSFSIRDFRIYWIGMFVSMCGTWIQVMAQSWLVFELSRSSFLLGLVGFLSSLPVFLFSLFSGVLVDRINKKILLIFAQVVAMLLAFLLAVFTQLNIVTVNFILLIAILNGMVLSLDAPARQAIVVELVGKKNILNGIALTSIGFHAARMLGPALAGIFIATISIAGCFYINAISFLAFIVALLMIKPQSPRRNNSDLRFMDDLKGGINFIRHNRIYLILISIVAVVSLFGLSYMILLPVFAKEVLNLDAKGFGLLMSFSGLGSLLAGLALAGLKDSHKKIQFMIFALYLLTFGLVFLAVSDSFIVSAVILVLIGFSILTSSVIINSMIQTMVPDEFRGRMMSIYVLTFAGTAPFGSIIAGSLAQMSGVRIALGTIGFICFVLFLLLTPLLKTAKASLSS